METNPYAAPAAVVADVRAGGVHDLDGRKASQGNRLGAASLDGKIKTARAAPMIRNVVLPIFGAKRLCLRDLIADTYVIDV